MVLLGDGRLCWILKCVALDSVSIHHTNELLYHQTVWVSKSVKRLETNQWLCMIVLKKGVLAFTYAYPGSYLYNYWAWTYSNRARICNKRALVNGLRSMVLTGQIRRICN